ncbi:AraC family transcriptional regulator [Nannocystis punicea]|uniref:AraC family transcriptional regulator n=1 Tax=Nannocystis punicea TaxID=2995304 RepID=A0ABY7GX69_9BACT|nr:AraC family transcriptional regulator [Nannocystis poenicansa]WAS91495.1 AraC family transcriptional regulator [Nannocystis poenicansa]
MTDPRRSSRGFSSLGNIMVLGGDPKAPSPISRISRSDLELLMRTLEVSFVRLSECVVSSGFGLMLGSHDAPGLHYNLRGHGVGYIGNGPAIELEPHTMIIVPPHSPLRIDVPGARSSSTVKLVDGKTNCTLIDGVHRYVAGGGTPDVLMICGFFHAVYASSISLFGTLSAPIVERFEACNMLDQTLKAALAELVSQEVGAHAMSSALLKQVIVTLLRRALSSPNSWVEQFSLLRDPQIARAFAVMVDNPGAPHTVQSLAGSASLSRSAFMARFHDVIGRSPMLVLRDLRMRQAARQLTSGTYSVEQVAANAGYESRSSFIRAFRNTFGLDPSSFRASRLSVSPSSAVGFDLDEK